MLRRFLSVVCMGLVIVALSAGIATAGSVSYLQEIVMQATDWGYTIALDKFHGDASQLTSIEFKVESGILGEIWLESENATSAPVEVKLGAAVELKKAATTLVASNPVFSHTYNLDAYDGVWDWGGSSGFKYAGIAESDVDTTTLTSGFGDYVGSGTFDLLLSAKSVSSVTGPGNLDSKLVTQAGGKVTVTYNYDVVPEPGSLMALMSGCLGLVGVAVRRRK